MWHKLLALGSHFQLCYEPPVSFWGLVGQSGLTSVLELLEAPLVLNGDTTWYLELRVG